MNNVVDVAAIAIALYVAVTEKYILYPNFSKPAKHAVHVALVTTLLVILYQHNTAWTDYLPIIATSLLPLLAAYSCLPTLFWAVNIYKLLGALSQECHSGWQQLITILVHVHLFVVNADAQSICTLKSTLWLIILTGERQVIRLWKAGRFSVDSMFQDAHLSNVYSIKYKFTYNPQQRLFLMYGLLKIAWQPLLPLYAIRAIFNALIAYQLVAEAYLFYCIDSTIDYAGYWCCGIGVLVLLLNLVSSLCDRLDNYIDSQWTQISHSILEHVLHKSFDNVKMQKPGSEELAWQAVNILTNNLRYWLSELTSLPGPIVAVWHIYQQVGWLVVMLPTVLLANAIIARMVDFLNHSSQKSKKKIPLHTAKLADEIYKDIRSIKYFGWEHRFLSHMNSHETLFKIPDVYSACTKAFVISIKTVNGFLDEIASCIVIYIQLHRQSRLSSLATNADLFKLRNLMMHSNSLMCLHLSNFKSLKLLVTKYNTIEEFLKGNYINTMTRIIDGANIKPYVAMNSCSFSWSGDGVTELENVSFSASAGELIVVTGATGSGKSTLLSAIGGELEMITGTGTTVGTISFMEQTPKLINGTIQANILWSRAYNKQWYHKVLTACALDTDISQWPKGDQTWVGKQGMTLSGGQQARLALARTIYTQADIYILEDPLSAVDAQVKRHIMEQVILDTGLLKGKLRIISSNTKHIIPFSNQVASIVDKKVFISKQTPQIYSPIVLCTADNNACPKFNEEKELDPNKMHKENDDSTLPNTQNAQSNPKPSGNYFMNLWISFKNVWYIVKICGIPAACITVVFGFIRPIAMYITNCYILDAITVDNSYDQSSMGSISTFILLNIVRCAVLNGVTRLTESIENYIAINMMSVKIQKSFIESILFAPLSFFDDISQQKLSHAYNRGAIGLSKGIVKFLLYKPAKIVGVVFSLYSIRHTTWSVMILAIAFNMIKAYYKSIINSVHFELKSMDDNANADEQETFTVVNEGKRLIRLYGVASHYITQLLKDKANANIAYYWSECFSLLLRLVEDVYVEIIDFAILLFMLVQQHSGIKKFSSNEYAIYTWIFEDITCEIGPILQIPETLHKLSKKVDVFKTFGNIKAEAPYIVPENWPASNWPSKGQIEFNNFSMRYSPQLPWSVHNINLTIYPGEKLGIVGRTGAGKSSLIKSLFRLVPNGTAGTITIDGVDIAQLGVGDLRPRLGIIPQEVGRLTGSFRDYLDPFNQHSIEDIWAALIKCGLASVIAQSNRGFSGNIDMTSCSISEGEYRQDLARYVQWEHSGFVKRAWLMLTGEVPQNYNQREMQSPLDSSAHNFLAPLSQGQQQLFSLCRLLLQKKQIVVLDEATAQVDMDTDHQLQQLLRQEFATCTMLTIAHRLETIMHSDRIVVLDQGRLVEIGTPTELLQKNGYFAELVKSDRF